MLSYKFLINNLNRTKIAEYLFVVLGLAILTSSIFIKLFPHYSTAIIGDQGDGTSFLWNFWWIKKSVWELHQNPFLSDYMFFPNNMDLRLHTLIMAPALITLPIQLLWGSMVALNTYVLISFLLSGIGAYILIKIYVKSRSAAFLGAMVYAFNTYVISHAYGHFNLTTTWPIPFVIYFLEKLNRTKKVKYAIYGSISYVFLIYSDLQYAIFAFLLMAIWIIWTIIRNIKIRQSCMPLLKGIGLFIFIVLICIIPFFSLIQLGFENSLVKPNQEAVEFYSPKNLLSYVIPPKGTAANKLISQYNPNLAKISPSAPEWAVYLGATVIILLPFIIIRLLIKKENSYIFWTVIFTLFIFLSFGPKINISEDFNIISPLANIYKLPFISMTRVPVRMIIIAMLAIAVLMSHLLI